MSESILKEEAAREVAAAQREGRAASSVRVKGRAAARVAGELSGINTVMDATMYDAEADRRAVETTRKVHEKAKGKLEDQLNNAWDIEDEYNRLAGSSSAADRAKAEAMREDFARTVQQAREEQARLRGKGLVNEQDPELIALQGSLDALRDDLAPVSPVEPAAVEPAPEEAPVEVASIPEPEEQPVVAEPQQEQADDTPSETTSEVARAGGRRSSGGGDFERLSPEDIADIAGDTRPENRGRGETSDVVVSDSDELDIDDALAELDDALDDLDMDDGLGDVHRGVARSAASADARRGAVSNTAAGVAWQQDNDFGRAAAQTNVAAGRIGSAVQQSSRSSHDRVVADRERARARERERERARARGNNGNSTGWGRGTGGTQTNTRPPTQQSQPTQPPTVASSPPPQPPRRPPSGGGTVSDIPTGGGLLGQD